MTEFNENNTENKEKQNASASFQDELRQNFRPIEELEKEKAEHAKIANELKKVELKQKAEKSLAEVKETFEEIKKTLIKNSKDVYYKTENEAITITCSCEIPKHFLIVKRNFVKHIENGIHKNNQHLCCISDDEAYYMYLYALRKMTAMENINFKIFVSAHYKKIPWEENWTCYGRFPFPCMFHSEEFFNEKNMKLYIEATTVVSLSSADSTKEESLLQNKKIDSDENMIAEILNNYKKLEQEVIEKERIELNDGCYSSLGIFVLIASFSYFALGEANEAIRFLILVLGIVTGIYILRPLMK